MIRVVKTRVLNGILVKHTHVPNMATNETIPHRATHTVKASFRVIGAFHRISTNHHIYTLTDSIT